MNHHAFPEFNRHDLEIPSQHYSLLNGNSAGQSPRLEGAPIAKRPQLSIVSHGEISVQGSVAAIEETSAPKPHEANESFVIKG